LLIVKIGLIGCGKQAVKHVAGFRKCGDVQIVLADRYSELARSLAETERVAWVETPEQIFADPEIVAVDLCVPTPFHAPLIRRALAADKDFFCEKPLCETASEARELRELTDRTGHIGMVGYVYRHAPVFQTARSIVAGTGNASSGPVLGKIAVALMRIGGRGSAAVWKHRHNEGGGAINEMLVHMLDLAVWYFGPIERAELLIKELFRPQRIIAGRMEDADAEDFVLARFWTQAGAPVVIEADLLTPAFTQVIEIQGDNGTLVASIQPEMPQFVFAIKPGGVYPAGRTDLTSAQVNLFDAQMATFVNAVRTRQRDVCATIADSEHVMRALEMLKHSRMPLRQSGQA
jgi:predicted dehydrogenase